MNVAHAAANVFDALLGGGLADLRRTPACIIDEGPKRAVYRYLAHDDRAQHALPVLLVPPLAGPTACFDLRRGCSMAEHLLAHGHPTAGTVVGHSPGEAKLAVLFTGQFPLGPRDFIVKAWRYGLRVQAYVGLLTDQYPPFSLQA